MSGAASAMREPVRSLRRSLVPAAFLIAVLLVATISCGTRHSVLAPTVDDFTASIEGPLVYLLWTRPPNVAGFVVLRRLNAAPERADDPAATVVYRGTNAEATENIAALEPSTAASPHTYHYAVFSCPDDVTCGGNPGRVTLTPSLLDCLRGGGYTLWWRHASAATCADRLDLGTAATTSAPGWWKSCDSNCPAGGTVTATARQLNEAGVAEAIAIGQRFDALGIPVGRVISSEYCRCVHTAELMDFGAVEQDSSISYFVYDEANRCTHSYERIEQPPAAGTNTALIGHAGFSSTCTTIGELAWGEAAIFKPQATGGATFIARLTWDQWAGLP